MRVGLKTKIVLIATTVMLFSTGAIVASSGYLFTQEYTGALESRSLAVSKSLKIQLERLLQLTLSIRVEDLIGVDRQCQDIVNTYEGIHFAMVVGESNEIVFHSDPARVGKVVSDAALLQAIANRRETILHHTEDGIPLSSAVVPVFRSGDRYVASVVIGFDAPLVADKAREILLFGFAIGLFFLVAGTVVMLFALSVYVTQPLGRLVNQIERLRKEASEESAERRRLGRRTFAPQRLGEQRVAVRSDDEIGHLARAFNDLMARVAERTTDLENAHHYLDDVIDSVADPIFVKDAKHRWVLLNKAFCDFVGRKRAELLGKSDYDFFPKNQADVFWMKDQIVFETGGENINEEEITDARGVLHTVVTKKVLYTDGGEKRIVGVISDISDRRRLEQQLRQAQKMESVGLLAGGIAHDFNNLLTPVIGNAELLVMRSALPESEQRLVSEIQHAGERASQLTRQLLAFGRKQMLELKTIDLAEVIARFEPMLRLTIREDVRIQLIISPSLGAVRADVGQLEQVLLNLALNARDAMASGGVLTIEAQNVELDTGYVSLHPEVKIGSYVMVAVSDTGTGMTHDIQQRLFEPFFTTKERGKGTGLGLSMVYGIVKQHGGSISVYSEPGTGTTFKIYLPRVTDAVNAEPAHQSSASSLRVRGGETILVVDDNDMVRSTACEMLRSLGYRVLSADSAEGCHRVAESHEGTIELLLTDVVLSKSNGREVYNTLKKQREGLKVVFMSGYTSNVVVQNGVVEQGVHFLPKPLSLKNLSTKIREALDET
jgi:PAS domain S-box-containing protein